MFKTKSLNQNDEKWGKMQLGNSSETIEGWGSLLTSVTMILNGIGYNETPQTVNEKLKQEGGFLRALLIPSCLPYLWPNCAYLGMQRCEDGLSAPISQIDRQVAAGKPVILQVDATAEKGVQTHFVLVKKKRGNDYVLYDPQRGADSDGEVLLTRRYKHNGAKLESEISAVLWFDFHDPALPKAPKVDRVQLPSKKLVVYAAQDAIAIRARPAMDGYPRKLVVMGTELICLDPDAAATARLGTANTNGKDGQWIKVQDPKGVQGFVAAWLVNSTSLPGLVAPPRDVLPFRKKWCLKNVPVEDPQFETWHTNGQTEPGHKPPRAFSILPKNTVVNVLSIIPGTSELDARAGITYQKMHRDPTLKKWVTTRVTGWVRDADLEDYCEDEREEFQKFAVRIRHQTENSTDAQQYLYIQDGGKLTTARYNMCGELSIAFIIEQDIDTVLAKWKEHSPAMYDKMVGKSDKPLGRPHIEDLLKVHIGPIEQNRWQRYKLDQHGNPLPSEEKDKNGNPQPHYIQLAFEDKLTRRIDQRRASEGFRKKLEDFYFITNLKIDTNTGNLIEAYAAEERNHWVVVDKVTHNGGRVELYNPFPNRRQEYTFGEFYTSIRGNPNSGWWIDRKVNPTFARQQSASMGGVAGSRDMHAESEVRPPRLEVAIENENKTPELTDAEQYIKVEGLKKTNLCGEFCISFILTQAMEGSLTRWMENQEKLKQQGEPMANLEELVSWLDAYGFIHRKPTPDENHKRKAFTIDSVLKYWKTIQPELYNSILGGSNNETTGPDDLTPILRAYGYQSATADRPADFTAGALLSSPSKTAEKLKTHFLITGVNISAKRGGQLGGFIAHWVVVDKITPVGTLVSGNGGWVELYNPFLNRWEEYSYREFMQAYLGAGLWVKRDISPVFSTQSRVGAKSKKKDAKNNNKPAATQGGVQESQIKRFTDRLKQGESPDAVARALANKLNLDPVSARKLLGLSTISYRPRLDVAKLMRKRLKVDSVPREIAWWIRDHASDDESRVEQLTDALREFGILIVDQKEKECRRIAFEEPGLSEALAAAVQRVVENSTASPRVRQVIHAMASSFVSQAMEGIRITYETIPVQAYKSWAEFRTWTHGLAAASPRDQFPQLFRVRPWGDPVMRKFEFDIKLKKNFNSNFQAVGLYNKAEGFGAISNYLIIPPEDVLRLEAMQLEDEYEDKVPDWLRQKMTWLCQERGSIYMFASKEFGDAPWRRSDGIRWGTLALGGNLVKVESVEEFDEELATPSGIKVRKMAKLIGFHSSDWNRPLDELLAEGLVHRCFAVHRDNSLGDSPKGIVYSPFWSLDDKWEFMPNNNGKRPPTALYIPFDYLEPKKDTA